MVNKINLEQEIEKITDNSVEEIFPTISCIIHNEKDDINIDQLLHVDVVRDFQKALTDTITLEFLLPLGTYVNELHKHKNKLEASLCFKKNFKQSCRRYKAIILNADKAAVSSKMQSVGTDELNKTNFVNTQIQLIPIELITLKKLKHEGIYRNVTPLEVVKYSILYELSKLKLYGTPFKLNLNIYKPEYHNKYENIIIPTGTKIGKIPNFIQHKYGYYNFDSNLYIQLDNNIKKNMFIWLYPTIDFDRVKKDQNIGMLYNTVKKGTNSNEKSYWLNNHQLKLVTDDVKITGDNNNELLNKGKGISFQSVTKNLKDINYDFKNDKDDYSVDENVLTTIDDDGMDDTTYVGLTDNTNLLTSAINNNRVAYIQTVIYNFTGLWEKEPLDQLIYPGMPFYYIYNSTIDGINKIMKLPGTILQQHINYNIKQKTMSSALLLGVKKPNIKD